MIMMEVVIMNNIIMAARTTSMDLINTMTSFNSKNHCKPTR